MRIPFHNIVRDHRSVERERGRLGERKAVVGSCCNFSI